jgi:formylglycine-generating enzyme required for sulfatase activity
MTASPAMWCNVTQPAPVGSFAPNTFGLHDMNGNVAEWCRDQWDGTTSYFMIPSFDPVGGSGILRVVRGGGWSAPAPFCRSASRGGMPLGFQSNAIGFRVVLGPIIP